jgi:hypothetical protein
VQEMRDRQEGKGDGEREDDHLPSDLMPG